MFEAYNQRLAEDSRRRFAVSAASAFAVYGLAAALALFLAHRAAEIVHETDIDVTFSPLPKAEPVAVAEVPKPQARARKVAVTPPQQLVSPTQLSDKPVEQAEPSDEPVVPDVGEGGGGGGGIGTGTRVASLVPVPPKVEPTPPPQPKPTPPPVAEPINLPEDATPPEAAADNALPEYPEEARAAGVEGMVILRLVIGQTGKIEKIQVLRGEEPLLTAAIKAVKKWKYRPAIVNGRPTRVFHIVKLPFRIRA